MQDFDTNFEKLGFWKDITEEDKIEVFGMDFEDGTYIIITDDAGKTPLDKTKGLILACYDSRDSFIWGSEFKNFAALEKVCQGKTECTGELLEALKNSSKGLK